ncbi:hypothetical protein CP981_33645 [Streptomyces platensis]|uniref:SIP-like Rossmann fold domain-containing protein n=1 Tax=Streptomyces platensis TaxID=58346 RepID=A0AAE6NTD9_STRPT|nr:hypothetical protein CP981_33645 [Streptomyces platensis]
MPPVHRRGTGIRRHRRDAGRPPETADVHGAVKSAPRHDVLPTWCGRDLAWRHCGAFCSAASDTLVQAIRGLDLPDEPGITYLAGEARTCQAVRRRLTHERGRPRRNILVKPFWRPAHAAWNSPSPARLSPEKPSSHELDFTSTSAAPGRESRRCPGGGEHSADRAGRRPAPRTPGSPTGHHPPWCPQPADRPRRDRTRPDTRGRPEAGHHWLADGHVLPRRPGTPPTRAAPEILSRTRPDPDRPHLDAARQRATRLPRPHLRAPRRNVDARHDVLPLAGSRHTARWAPLPQGSATGRSGHLREDQPKASGSRQPPRDGPGERDGRGSARIDAYFPGDRLPRSPPAQVRRARMARGRPSG